MHTDNFNCQIKYFIFDSIFIALKDLCYYVKCNHSLSKQTPFLRSSDFWLILSESFNIFVYFICTFVTF